MSSKRVSNKIISLTFLTAAILSFNLSCSENKNDEINGNWISADYSLDVGFTTLSINDSTLIENPFGIYRWEYFVQYEETFHEVLYPFDSWETMGIIYVKNDTLTLIKNYNQDTLKYIRLNTEQIGIDLTFSEYPIAISLPKSEGGDYFMFDRRGPYEPIFIGKLKKGNQSKFSEISTDSVLLHVDDIFISFNEITEWIKITRTKLDEFDRSELIISICADTEVPDSFLKTLNAKVKESGLKAARAYKDSTDHKIYFKMLD